MSNARSNADEAGRDLPGRASVGCNTALHANPFFILGVNTRDGSRKIVESAEERSLHIDHDLCHRARSDLTSPRSRLAAELGWMPGVSPGMADKLTIALSENPMSVRTDEGLPVLARANLMAAAFELVNEEESATSVAGFIRDFAWVLESVNPHDVLRDVNEDRAVSGFPEVPGVDAIEVALAERRKTYLLILRNLLDSMDTEKLVETVTQAVSVATNGGEKHGPALLDALVDSFESDAQGFFQKESDSIVALVQNAREAAPRGEKSVAAILDSLEQVARNWSRVAKPINISAKSRGTVHRQSHEVASYLRNLGVELNNEHSMLDQAHRIIAFLREIFPELPEVAERVEQDAEAIAELRHQAREITFDAEVGLLFKEPLAISASGVSWKGKIYPLKSIARVRWGGVQHSINGIPTGTDYTVAFGDTDTQQEISLRKQSTYSGFVDALWRAVGVRLMVDMMKALSEGRAFPFGTITVEDSTVTLIKHKIFGANEKIGLTWHEVEVWSAGGSFFVGMKGDKKTYGAASYIQTWNTHVLEQIIRASFKTGARKLSDLLKS